MSLNDKLRELLGAKTEQQQGDAASFLAENAQRPEVIVLPSGLQYEVLEMGSGDAPIS